jgi:8-oxo-dGTP pyrophosphatase MutT (NUDIX family)
MLFDFWLKATALTQRYRGLRLALAFIGVVALTALLIYLNSGGMASFLLNSVMGALLLGVLVELVTGTSVALIRRGAINPFRSKALRILNQLNRFMAEMDIDSTAQVEKSPTRYHDCIVDHKIVLVVESLFARRLSVTAEVARKLLSPEECALVVLFCNLAPSVLKFLDDPKNGSSPYFFREIAVNAASVAEYRQIMLTMSISRYFPRNSFKVAQSTLARSIGLIESTQEREIGDERLRTRAIRAEGEEYYVTSVTSQVTNLSFNIFQGLTERVHAIHFLVVHPDILRHTALKELEKEYRVPNSCIPPNQFLIYKDNNAIDFLRRMLRILAGVRGLLAFSQDNPTTLVKAYFFCDAYPGVRIRLATHRQYLQLFPGCLDVANNLYRFGIEIADSEIVSMYYEAMKSQCAGQNRYSIAEAFELNEDNYRLLEKNSLRSIFRYLIMNGIDSSMLQDARSELFQIVPPDKDNRRIYDEILRLYARTDSVIEGAEIEITPESTSTFSTVLCIRCRKNTLIVDSENENLIYRCLSCGQKSGRAIETSGIRVDYLDDGTIRHHSVGAIIKKDDKFLVVKKRSWPYKYSIVAGHLNESESPIEAILREIKEEIGVSPASIRLLFYVPGLADSCRKGADIHDWHLYDCELDQDTLSAAQSADEIDSIHWVTVSEAMNLEFTTAAKYMLDRVGLLH